MLDLLSHGFAFLNNLIKAGRWKIMFAGLLVSISVAGKMYHDDTRAQDREEMNRLDRKIAEHEKTDLKILSGIKILNNTLKGFGTRIEDIKKDTQIMKADVSDTQKRVLEIYRERSLAKEGS